MSSLSWNWDGSLLASGCLSGVVNVHNILAGNALAPLRSVDGKVQSLRDTAAGPVADSHSLFATFPLHPCKRHHLHPLAMRASCVSGTATPGRVCAPWPAATPTAALPLHSRRAASCSCAAWGMISASLCMMRSRGSKCSANSLIFYLPPTPPDLCSNFPALSRHLMQARTCFQSALPMMEQHWHVALVTVCLRLSFD